MIGTIRRGPDGDRGLGTERVSRTERRLERIYCTAARVGNETSICFTFGPRHEPQLSKMRTNDTSHDSCIWGKGRQGGRCPRNRFSLSCSSGSYKPGRITRHRPHVTQDATRLLRLCWHLLGVDLPPVSSRTRSFHDCLDRL